MILVTGGSGLVGNLLQQKLKSLGHEFVAPNRSVMDLSNGEAIRECLKNNAPQCVIHLAAETNVDLCEIQKSHAISINLEATKVMADYCAEHSVRFIFISTSGVLAGSTKLIGSELDLPSPTNFYSLSKLRAEEYIQKKCSNYLIIRAAWMLGVTEGNNKKFAEKITMQILSQVEKIKAVSDLYGSITSGNRLAEFICKNLTGVSEDLIHCASSTICSRYDIAKHIKQKFGSKTEIAPVNSCEFPLSATRGLSEGLSSEIAQKKYGYVALSWEEELDDFLQNFSIQK